LRSLVPGGAFLVQFGPRAAVLRHRRPDDLPAFAGPRVLLVSEPGLPADLARRLADLARATSVRVVHLAGGWEPVLGTPAAVQIALVPADAGSVHVLPSGRCPACGLLSGSGVCGFCHLVTEVPVAQPARPA
jgi:hypothetical protein